MDVKLPRLAEGVDSGVVVSILVSEGQEIKKDQPFIELETQKAVGSIPSPESGTVSKIHVKEGMEVAVGQLLISISADKDSAVAKPATGEQAPAPTAVERPAQTRSSTTSPASAEAKFAPQAEDYRYESKSGAAPPASPSIRKIAGDLGIDLTRVKGSEAGGRIVLSDVRAYIQRLQQRPLEEAKDAPRHRFTTGSGSAAKRAHRFRQMGSHSTGTDVASEANRQPPDGRVLDNHSQNQPI